MSRRIWIPSVLVPLRDTGPTQVGRANNGLVDEMNLFIFPVVVGQNMRLIPDRARTERSTYRLASHPEGVTIQVYRPAGRPQYGTASPDTNT